MAVLRMRGVHKAFEGKAVLRGVDLEVEAGETLVVLGRSGSGKSVILKHLIGLTSPDAGSIEVAGTEITTLRGAALHRACARVAMLFQSAALFDSLLVWENVGFHLLENLNLPEAEVRPRVTEKLAMVGLHGIEELSPAELSGGMRKRVGLARTLMLEPEVLLWDEPTSGLDPVTSDLINRLILKMQRELGLTSVVVTHDMTSAYKVGTRLAMLHDGAIIGTGTPEAIRATADPVIGQFIRGDAEGPLTAGVED